MPSTIYKGDLAEVAFASEAGLRILDGTNSVKLTLQNGNEIKKPKTV